jgi:hypothetical protein
MCARIADRQGGEEPYGLRGVLTMIVASLLLLVVAAVLLRLVGWFLLGAYAFGLWGLAGFVRGAVELARLPGSTRRHAAHARDEEVDHVPTHPGRL